MKNGGGNDGLWTRRETKSRFSSAPTSPWKSPKAGDSHIPTATTTRPDGKVEIQEQDSHFPTGPITHFQNKRKEAWRRLALLPPSGSSCVRIKTVLQAHSSMRICSPCAKPAISHRLDQTDPSTRRCRLQGAT